MSIETENPTAAGRCRRCCLLALFISLALIALLFVLALALVFTVFRVRAPTSELLASDVSGLSFSLPPATLARPDPPLVPAGFPHLPLPGSPPSTNVHQPLPDLPAGFPHLPLPGSPPSPNVHQPLPDLPAGLPHLPLPGSPPSPNVQQPVPDLPAGFPHLPLPGSPPSPNVQQPLPDLPNFPFPFPALPTIHHPGFTPPLPASSPHLPLPGSPPSPNVQQPLPDLPNFPFPTFPIFHRPGLTPPEISPKGLPFGLKLSLELLVRVNNPNRFEFTHRDVDVKLLYRGVWIGDAKVKPGRTPARGSEVVHISIEVEAERMAPELGHAFLDYLGGEMAFDMETKIVGKVSVFRILKRKIVATSKCRVVVGFPEGKVRSSQCTLQTKI